MLIDLTFDKNRYHIYVMKEES